MDEHRKDNSVSLELISIRPPFSNFDYNELNFSSSPAIHRCFSLARSAGAQTLVIEEMSESGLVADENRELVGLIPDYKMTGLKRLSFWKSDFENAEKIKFKSNDELVGYAILKKDHSDLKSYDDWHIFEAIFSKYPHKHNCVARAPEYSINVAGRFFSIKGILYCQQNTLNKACAQVALRSILSKRLPQGDIAYSKINQLAMKAHSGAAFDPSMGLSPAHIKQILDDLNVPYRDLDYSQSEVRYPKIRTELPFQKYLYSGVESGCGALLGFRLNRRNDEDERHIIPFFGHTFNKDTWAPDANASYFQIGRRVGYIPSESWTSSFIGHDDNFGANYCVPRSYIEPEQAEYVVEFLEDDFMLSGMQAESLGLMILYSLERYLAADPNKWVNRLAAASSKMSQRVVLRAIAVRKSEYIAHLNSIRDWDNNSENPTLATVLDPVLPKMVWVIEISLPQLFPANEHKLGEVVLNPYIPYDFTENNNFDNFLFARVPGSYFIVKEIVKGVPSFVNIPSQIMSHTEVLTI